MDWKLTDGAEFNKVKEPAITGKEKKGEVPCICTRRALPCLGASMRRGGKGCQPTHVLLLSLILFAVAVAKMVLMLLTAALLVLSLQLQDWVNMGAGGPA